MPNLFCVPIININGNNVAKNTISLNKDEKLLKRIKKFNKDFRIWYQAFNIYIIKYNG